MHWPARRVLWAENNTNLTERIGLGSKAIAEILSSLHTKSFLINLVVVFYWKGMCASD